MAGRGGSFWIWSIPSEILQVLLLTVAAQRSIDFHSKQKLRSQIAEGNTHLSSMTLPPGHEQNYMYTHMSSLYVYGQEANIVQLGKRVQI